MAPIGFVSSEAKDKIKVADYDSTRSPSQCFTEQAQEIFSLPVSQFFSTKKLIMKPLYLLRGINTAG